MHVSVIIPIFNEGNIIKSNIEKIHNFFENTYKYDIILIDDCSNDNTKDILNSLQIKNLKILYNKKNKGKGYSIKKGIEVSAGDIILTTDADFSTSIEEFNRLLLRYKQGYSFIIGSRSKENSIINIKQNQLRVLFGIIFNLFVKLILGLKFRDTQCGFKLYDAEKIKSIIKLCKVNRFCADVEILYLASLKEISVFEEGIVWENNKDSTVKLFADSINMFIDLIKIKFTKY